MIAREVSPHYNFDGGGASSPHTIDVAAAGVNADAVSANAIVGDHVRVRGCCS